MKSEKHKYTKIVLLSTVSHVTLLWKNLSEKISNFISVNGKIFNVFTFTILWTSFALFEVVL